MKTIYGIDHKKSHFKNPVLAIGVFDGVHLGHQHLMKMTIKKARAIRGTAMAMTFSPHPVQVLHPEDHLPILTPLSYRLKLLKDLGIEVCWVIRFTKKFSHLSPQHFIQRYIADAIKAKVIIVGDDFRFGQNRSGTLDLFQKAGERYGFQVIGRHRVKSHKKVISSTLIRKWIAEGKFAEASGLLGRAVCLFGKVTRGDGRGKKLGFPTANVDLTNEAIPPSGVYLVNVLIEGEYPGRKYHGVANIGYRPSFKKASRINAEVHILNFHRNIYGKNITVEFIKKLRNEKYFPSPQDLIEQICKDTQKAKTFFRSRNS